MDGPLDLSELTAIDEELTGLLLKRARIARTLKELKIPLREILEWESRASRQLVRSLPPDVSHESFTEILNCVWNYSRPDLAELQPRVACLGPAGTFSHIAALRLFAGEAEFKLMSDVRGILEFVMRESDSYGLLSIRNSNSGCISENIELLDVAYGKGVRIVESLNVLVELSLMGTGPLGSVQTILSHAQAIAQCRWQIEELQRSDSCNALQIMETASTSDAARIVSLDSTQTMAAIVHRNIGEAYGLRVLVDPFEDRSGTTTNFVLVAKEDVLPSASGRDMTALVFRLREPESPGTLIKCLQSLSTFNLSAVQSWIPQGFVSNMDAAGGYMFFVEFEGHPAELGVSRAIESMRLTCADKYPKVLGTYVRPERSVGVSHRGPSSKW